MLSPSAPLLESTRSALQIRGQVVGRNMAALVPRQMILHPQGHPSEWVDLGFSRERAETAEFIPAPSGYISDNVVAFGLICNFLEDEERCDRWRSRWKSCRGRGHVGVPSNLQRDWRAGRDTRRGRPSLLLLVSCIFAAKNPLNARQEDPWGQRV